MIAEPRFGLRGRNYVVLAWSSAQELRGNADGRFPSGDHNNIYHIVHNDIGIDLIDSQEHDD